jgi:uncharacterized protein YdeI (YjbR/CyaY-like superfamily)
MPEKTRPITISFEDADAMRQWLEVNYGLTEGIWLKMAKKEAPITTVTYQDALQVALCFGWIDGQANKLDEHFYLQKFTPRRKRSIWSKRNVDIAERLITEGKMHPAGMLEIEKAKADGRWENAYESSRNMAIPKDFLKAVAENEQANQFFQTLNKTNLFAIAFRLTTAKSPATRAKRFTQIMEMLERKEKLY